MSTVYDAVVVGAGPAGSATAALLADAGLHVALLERARFPRPKPCAEYLSPEASRILDRLGVLTDLEAAGSARLMGMRIVSPGGTPFEGRFAGAAPFHGYTPHGLALRREILDTRLAEAAVRRGVTFVEAHTVEEVEEPAGGWRAVTARCGGQRRTFRGRVVIGSDGLHSRVSRVLGVRRLAGPRRVALVSHAAGVAEMGDVGEMHVGRDGYVGLAPVGSGITNVTVVLDLARTRRRGDRESWFRWGLARFPAVQRRLGRATFVTPVRAVGPFGRRARRAADDRILLVGDAADFYDPFTGEGIYAALRGAELVAAHAVPALADDRLGAADLAPYDVARRRAFGGKWVVERLVAWAVARPALLDHVARRLANRPYLADLLVGVTGDFVPPRVVLRPSFAWQLIK